MKWKKKKVSESIPIPRLAPVIQTTWNNVHKEKKKEKKNSFEEKEKKKEKKQSL